MIFDLETYIANPVVLTGPFLVSFIAGVSAFPAYIKWLKQKQLGQFLREEGPASHAHKAKTPTMGGICFMAVTVILLAISGVLIHRAGSALSAWALFVAVLCGLIGLSDDLSKLKSKSNEGLSARTRLRLEAILGAGFGTLGFALLRHSSQTLPAILLPQQIAFSLFQHVHVFAPGKVGIPLDLPVFVVLSTFLICATTNAINLHDGMDGLAGGTGLIVLATMGTMLWFTGQYELAWLAFVACGSIAAFLAFNRNPAKVFMGDTGSLFLGGLLATLTLAGGLLFWFVPLSLIFIVETLSVIMQVSYYKITKPYTPEKPMKSAALVLYKLTNKLPGEGKRIFRMAPLHHHFEAVFAEKGVKEWQVVAGFWVIQLILSGLTLAAFFVF